MKFVKFSYYKRQAGCICFSLVLLLVCYSDFFAAFEKTDAGALPGSMGNSVVALSNSSFAIYYNPAALPDSLNFEIALSYQLIYGLRNIAQADIVINFPIATQPLSLALSSLGNRYYQEIQIYLGTKYNITPLCAIGGSIQYYQLSIIRYGQQSTWGLNLALLYTLTSKLQLGAIVTNINKPRISETMESLPQTMNLGLSYKPLEGLTLCLALFRDIRFHQEFRFGISYQLIPALDFRAGVEDQINTYCFGLGINSGWIEFDYAIRIHPVLGASHIFTLMVTL